MGKSLKQKAAEGDMEALQKLVNWRNYYAEEAEEEIEELQTCFRQLKEAADRLPDSEFWASSKKKELLAQCERRLEELKILFMSNLL